MSTVATPNLRRYPVGSRGVQTVGESGEPATAAIAERWRKRVAAWLEKPRVQHVIIALIVINAVTLGLETSPAVMASIGPWLLAVDNLILGVFVVEIGARLFAYRWQFFRNAWNVFDFTIVAIALIPASGPLAVLRALRVLRVLRLLSMVPKLRFVVESLLRAIPGIGAIAGLMALIFYVFAVMATSLYGSTYPAWFGSLGASMYTLFQIMTLESWSMGIVRPVMETHPHAWLFFVAFIVIATFTVLNLFIALIVNTMQTMHVSAAEREQPVNAESVDRKRGVEAQLQSLHQELRELKSLLHAQALNRSQGRDASTSGRRPG